MIYWIRGRIIILMYFVGCYFSVNVLWKFLAWVLNEPYTIQMSNTIISVLLGFMFAQVVTSMGSNYREEVEDYDV